MKSLPSSAPSRIRKLKRALVLQVFLRDGDFWEAVRAKMDEWGIVPEERLPPAELPLPLAEGDPVQLRRWSLAVKEVRMVFLPGVYSRASDWDAFVAACILYDPPELELAEFAEYGGLMAETALPPNEARGGDRGSLSMVGAPVKWLPHPAMVAESDRMFYEAIIAELGERYVKPQGKDTLEAVEEILRDTGLREDWWERRGRRSEQPYISVNAYTKEDDGLSARHLILEELEIRDEGGRPRRYDLLAVKCAALHRDHNATNPDDKRYKRWTYEKLAKAFGLDSERIAEAYVKRGQELRIIHEMNRAT
jgi:hypothetical protein